MPITILNSRISRRTFAKSCSALTLGLAMPSKARGQAIQFAGPWNTYQPCFNVAPGLVQPGAKETYSAPVRSTPSDLFTREDDALIEQNAGAVSFLASNQADASARAASAVASGAPDAQSLGLPASAPARLAALSRWSNLNTLEVFFYGQRPTTFIDRILNIVNGGLGDKNYTGTRGWGDYANLNFKYTSSSTNAHIRINTDLAGGHWSFIGPHNSVGQTMNLAIDVNHTLRPSDYDYGVVLHEFGHALGCIHEHQQPNQQGLFNDQAVIDYYAQRYQWDANKTRLNVLYRYQNNQLLRGLVSAFDPASVMLYQVPPELTRDRQGTRQNTVLSAIDKQYIAKMYPGRNFMDVPGVTPPSLGSGLTTKIEVDGERKQSNLKPGQIDRFSFEHRGGPIELVTDGTTQVAVKLFREGSTLDLLEKKRLRSPDLVNLQDKMVLEAGKYELTITHRYEGGAGVYGVKLRTKN